MNKLNCGIKIKIHKHLNDINIYAKSNQDQTDQFTQKLIKELIILEENGRTDPQLHNQCLVVFLLETLSITKTT